MIPFDATTTDGIVNLLVSEHAEEVSKEPLIKAAIPGWVSIVGQGNLGKRPVGLILADRFLRILQVQAWVAGRKVRWTSTRLAKAKRG